LAWAWFLLGTLALGRYLLGIGLLCLLLGLIIFPVFVIVTIIVTIVLTIIISAKAAFLFG